MRNALSALALLVGIALFMAVTWAGCGAFLKNNEAYERGLATALADPTVHKVLGAPVEESWFLNGSIESDGGRARGSWSTRVRGQTGAGTLYIAGAKREGRWGVVALTLTVDGTTYTYTRGQGFRPADPATLPDFDIL